MLLKVYMKMREFTPYFAAVIRDWHVTHYF